MFKKLPSAFEIAYQQGQTLLKNVYRNTANPFLDSQVDVSQMSKYAKRNANENATDKTDAGAVANTKGISDNENLLNSDAPDYDTTDISTNNFATSTFKFLSIYTIAVIIVFVVSLIYLGTDTIWQKFIFSIIAVTTAQTLTYINFGRSVNVS